MASTRLPGKPLADIHGKPMIVHVLDRAPRGRIGPVAVACGDPEIADAVRAAGGTAVHDRPVAAPRLRPRARRAGRARPAGPLRRGGQPAGRPADHPPRLPAHRAHPAVGPGLRHRHPGRPDHLARGGGRCPPWSRPPAPSTAAARFAGAVFLPRRRSPGATGRCWHHIGIYAFRRAALARFVACPEAPLERRESLEQLRALEAGMRVACARVEHAPFGVDTAADLERARDGAAAARTRAGSTDPA